MATKHGEKQGKEKPGKENLRHDFTHEERVANGRKGGVRSGEVKRATKSFRESVQALLDCHLPEDKRGELEALGFEPTYRNQIVLAAIKKGAVGDIAASSFVRDTGGEKPREGLEIGNLDGKPLECLELSKLTDEELIAMIGH